eukprot:m.358772 g.358772  ORF g.358772 m.358772 type:complete len:181 (-) comp18279_c0_seq1:175-717(-)
MEREIQALCGQSAAQLTSMTSSFFSVQVDGQDATAATSEFNTRELKHAFDSLSLVVLDAARCHTMPDALASMLEDSGMAADQIEAIVTPYTANFEKLRSQLRRQATELPHIVDVAWRLDYSIKTQTQERIHAPMYHITFKTSQGAGMEEGKVQLTCTQAELADLVSQLKDAQQAVEKNTA